MIEILSCPNLGEESISQVKMTVFLFDSIYEYEKHAKVSLFV